MHLKAISNGQGGQSTYLLWLATQGKFPCDVSITADTGDELDSMLSTGEKISAREYFEQFTKPLANKAGIDAAFVRVKTKDGNKRQSISKEMSPTRISIPVYGSRGGQMKQTCTGRWKISAIKQEARKRGAKHLHSYLGIHYGEAARRVKGRFIGKQDGFDTYKPQIKKKGVFVDIKWMSHSYPLVDLKMNRNDVREELERLKIPYLISSECDFCPHQDFARWSRRSKETIERASKLEEIFEGEYFLTDLRVPLKEALKILEEEHQRQPDLFEREADFGCEGGYCGV